MHIKIIVAIYRFYKKSIMTIIIFVHIIFIYLIIYIILYYLFIHIYIIMPENSHRRKSSLLYIIIVKM